MSLREVYRSVLGKDKKNPLFDGKDRYNIVRELKREIKPLRKMGEKPNRDTLSFGRYFCDLCGKSYQLTSLSQCNICGRWVCRGKCLSRKYSICNSCKGVLELISTFQK